MMKHKIWCPLTTERKERTLMNKIILIVGMLWVIGGGFYFNHFSLAQQIEDENAVLMPVEQFVHLSFVDSFPFEKIKQYSATPKIQADTVKRLAEMLKTDCTPYCTNILTMLGIIGGPNSGDAIITFLQQDNESLFAKEKADALMILGYWINNAEETTKRNLVKIKAQGMGQGREMGSEKESADRQMLVEANNALINKATEFSNCLVSEIQNGRSECSGNQKTEIISPSQMIIRKRAAITGLALTGSKHIKVKVMENGENKDMTVKDYLELLLKNTEVGTSSRAHITEALEAQNGIAALGLACYYEKRSSECQGNIKRFIGQK
ncbi:hypothetical protein [Nitrospira sp. Ecomares 2.1]